MGLAPFIHYKAILDTAHLVPLQLLTDRFFSDQKLNSQRGAAEPYLRAHLPTRHMPDLACFSSQILVASKVYKLSVTGAKAQDPKRSSQG